MPTEQSPLQRAAYDQARETLEDEGYTSGAMQSAADISEALFLMAAEGERLVALEQDLRSRLDDVDDEAALGADE